MKYKKLKKAIVMLADGTVFEGKSIGIEGTATGEICFNTGMTGYQEVFTDPSYFGQLMVTTNAHIGNYGVHPEEIESDGIKISGLICRNFSFEYSRIGEIDSLENEFVKSNLVAITNVDTRALVSYIRDKGAMNAIISTEIDDLEALKQQLNAIPEMTGLELASSVSTKEAYEVGEGGDIKIAAVDLGIKKNILRNLVKRGCHVKVFPYNTDLNTLKSFNPDGYFFSNGPGDPAPLSDAIGVAKEIIEENLPLFGICLGHQVIGLSQGIETYKMHNGHRGINHPVKNIRTGKGEITSQNHGFVMDRNLVESNDTIEISHVHLNDQTVAGIRIKNKKCFSVQYHPEANPGPHDSSYLFDEFVQLVKENK